MTADEFVAWDSGGVSGSLWQLVNAAPSTLRAGDVANLHSIDLAVGLTTFYDTTTPRG